MASILIKNGRVWDGERFFYADVLTEGDRISKIEPHISEKAEFVYDAAGKTVTPGLVDAHVHMRGLNKKFGIHVELSSIPFGVTAAADVCAAYGDKALLDYTDEGFDMTDGAGNHICNTKGYRCVLTVSDGQVVFRD